MTEPSPKSSTASTAGQHGDILLSASGPSEKTNSPFLAAIERAEKHYRSLSHIDDICLVPAPGGKAAPARLFAVVVPNAAELTARKVASARERIGELLDIAGCVLPPELRVGNFSLIGRPLSRGPDGRLRRDEITIQYSAHVSAAGPAYSKSAAAGDSGRRFDSSNAQHFLARLRDVLHTAGPIAPDQNLETDLGMDSLAQIELRAVLEDEFGVFIGDGELWRAQTVGDLLVRLSDIAAEAGKSTPQNFWRSELRRPAKTAADCFDKPPSLFARAFFRLLRAFVRLTLRHVYRASVSGLEKIPPSGRLLLCPNHLSYLDSPIIHCLLPRRLIDRTYFLGYREIFREPPLTWMVRPCRLILTGDAESVLDSLRLCYQALERDQAVCIFPEGIRSTTGTFMRARPGTGMLACEAQAPVVPILIEGSEATLSPPKPGFHLCRIRVVVGDPIQPPPGGHFTVSDYRAVADRWREAVLRLRDGLAGSPAGGDALPRSR